MYTADSTVQVNIRLSKEIYDRAAQTAADEQCRFEDLLSVLVSEGLETHTTVRWLFEQVSILYRTRLECEGKLSQTPNEVLQELRIQREQIARELYPG